MEQSGPNLGPSLASGQKWSRDRKNHPRGGDFSLSKRPRAAGNPPTRNIKLMGFNTPYRSLLRHKHYILYSATTNQTDACRPSSQPGQLIDVSFNLRCASPQLNPRTHPRRFLQPGLLRSCSGSGARGIPPARLRDRSLQPGCGSPPRRRVGFLRCRSGSLGWP